MIARASLLVFGLHDGSHALVTDAHHTGRRCRRPARCHTGTRCREPRALDAAAGLAVDLDTRTRGAFDGWLTPGAHRRPFAIRTAGLIHAIGLTARRGSGIAAHRLAAAGLGTSTALLRTHHAADGMVIERHVATAGLQQQHVGIEGADLPVQAGAGDQIDIHPGARPAQAVERGELLVEQGRIRRRLLGRCGRGLPG